MLPGDEPYHSESERISSEISLIPLIKIGGTALEFV